LDADLIMFVVKMLAMYGEPDDILLVRGIACDPECGSSFLWQIVFNQLGRWQDNISRVLEEFRDPLPLQFAGIAFLDFCNELAIKGSLSKHPFDSPDGRVRLRGWLSSKETSSYAVSATAALPFLAAETGAELAAIAASHPDVAVQIEGAWAEAKMGRDTGLERLAAFACSPVYAERAVRYLEELGRTDRVPEQARTPEARALAEMAQWLAHPNELGKAPEEVSVADTRELFWPPTNDRRHLWVIRYTYRDDGDQALRESYGMVGSRTWAMMSKESQVSDPTDIYAIHCCWELEMNGDPSAPRERTIAAGRRLLAQRNPEFRLRGV
jgi:hypothetical protein